MKKGIFKRLRMSWKAMTTEEKVGLVVDILCGVGSTSMGIVAGNKMSEGRGVLEGICIRTTTTGLALYGGEIASKALRENYVPVAAALIDKAKEKSKPAEEEADKDE